MSDEKRPQRIPLPPVLLSIVPWFAAVATAGILLGFFPQLGPLVTLAATVVVFGLTVAWLARRVRRDDA